ncbi:putative E3 ubiquitin-protein ligase XBOS35 [Dichanthelium oligosanthes]|uniref:Putative E3 ubiquitin-protein ligase XBOS35 n=1 Tax=Dichanthelium oligosanthes TaxID=888268 RepID=A0A1E5UXN5_9POAL|nr:putative E3 ubiquitin-protein ligase XBOS35 [Dichanthelium oligosanthes]
MGDSFGCSATGERLVSAARDGDIQEARALLELNPRLARYSTFGIRNSPLHYSAAKGHHETALMQACLYGHWKVVQILVLFKANIHWRDCFSGATAIHFAALKGHTRCIRLLVADYVPSLSEFWNVMRGKSTDETKKDAFDVLYVKILTFIYVGIFLITYKFVSFALVLSGRSFMWPSSLTGKFTSFLLVLSRSLRRLISGKSDGGVTPLHLAALHGHAESVQLLLDLGASVFDVTINDGSTIDLIGSGSTPLHYAACGGSAVCCQLLIAAGANMGAENANGMTPRDVACSWHKSSVQGILSKQPEGRIRILPSPYLCLPLMSIVKIARECGWRKTSASSTCQDPCIICLEVECTVAAEGTEKLTRDALFNPANIINNCMF